MKVPVLTLNSLLVSKTFVQPVTTVAVLFGMLCALELRDATFVFVLPMTFANVPAVLVIEPPAQSPVPVNVGDASGA